ncbi:uncharacterized protein LOC133155552 isoform X2 [Syngnathus typhle]|uniref:uncharacterized protein LOC133155552 isoform X2 n=1 Tax=Syngnathus typhle TaxID=161592 RepID=UPI002A6AF552|nr:uncharacterized protein LOC133155552 isoform X2 [Syngnathus typhle]
MRTSALFFGGSGLNEAQKIGDHFGHQQEPLPYMVSQPLPWQVHSVSHSRRSSKAEELDGFRRNSMGVYRKYSNASNGTCCSEVLGPPPLSPVDKAAATIQTHFRKFQQKKLKNGK